MNGYSTSGFTVEAGNEVVNWYGGTAVYLTRFQCQLYGRFAQPGINAGKNVNAGIYAIGDRPRWMYRDPEDEQEDWSNQGDNIALGTAVFIEEFTGVEKAYNYYLSDWYSSDEFAPVQPWATYVGPSCGYEMKAVFAVEEWAIEGGFEYQ